MLSGWFSVFIQPRWNPVIRKSVRQNLKIRIPVFPEPCTRRFVGCAEKQTHGKGAETVGRTGKQIGKLFRVADPAEIERKEIRRPEVAPE